MKALFVLHEGVFIYGANRSISGVLKNTEYDYDLMIGRSFTKKPDERELREMFGSHLRNIYVVWLPRYRCHVYDRLSLYSECAQIVNNVMAFLHAPGRKRIIRKGGYDYVHLNSVVLYPMVDSSARYVMHMREFLNERYRRIGNVVRALQQVRGVIYIDKKTRVITEKIVVNANSILLNNPFDMTWVQDVDYGESLKRYGLSPQNVVFAMLGQICDFKGSRRVIEAFMRHRNENSRLLIAGNDEHAYARECREMARDDKRILFCGELKDTGSIYRVSDYIIRGEADFGIGRTIYEGLFSGAGVIVPGRPENLLDMPESDSFREDIYLCDVENGQDLTEVIDECARHKRTGRQFLSNIGEYMTKYNAFIDRILADGGEEE